LLPTATDELLGSEKWGLGPTGVVLTQRGPWTYGALANHIWSVGGESDRADISATFVQPFLSYTTKTATTFGLNTESTYDWKSNRWTVPINATVSQVLKLGNQLIQVGGGVRYWAKSPASGPEGWGYRVTLTFLFPK
jgi:aryl-phospho-beta-D-glucosidase BglC (GH1 family)